MLGSDAEQKSSPSAYGSTFSGMPAGVMTDHCASHASNHRATDGVIWPRNAFSRHSLEGCFPTSFFANNCAQNSPYARANRGALAAMPSTIVADHRSGDPPEGGSRKRFRTKELGLHICPNSRKNQPNPESVHRCNAP